MTKSEWNPERLFSEIVMPAQMELIRMEYRGVRVDENLRQSRKAEFEQRIEELKSDPVLEGVNPWSPDQVKEKLRSWKVTRARSVDERTLKKIRAKRPDVAAFVTQVLECRKARKLKSTYMEAKTHDDGRLRTSYRLFTVETGRGRSGKDVFDLGTNMQNFPQSQRDWIVPDPGKVFWAADASQIEARVVAWLAQDDTYVHSFIEGHDVHTEHAVAMFNVPEERVRDTIPGSERSYRDSGKRVTHSWGYWISPYGLAARINDEIPELEYSVRDAENHLRALDKLRPGVVRWRLGLVEHLKSNRTLVTPFGRPRTFMGISRASDPIPSGLHREAVAHLPQSTAGDHMHRALVQTANELRRRGLDAECLLYTHDEIAGQCAPEHLDAVREVVCGAIQTPMPLTYGSYALECPADFGSGPSWKDSHP
jgi:DNA polymerase-1